MAKTINPLDLTRWESLQDLGQTVDPLESLLQLSSSWKDIQKGNEQRDLKGAQLRASNITTLIGATNTIEGLNNLLSAVDTFDQNTDNREWSELGDIPKLLHSQKSESFNTAQAGYDTLIDLTNKYKLGSETDFKVTEDLIMRDNLFSNKELLTKIAIAQNRLTQASKTGFRPKGPMDLEALSVHANTLNDFIGKKINLLVSSGNFDIKDPQIEEFKDTFGPQMFALNQAEFGKYLDGYRNLLGQKFRAAESQANTYYNLMARAKEQGTSNSSDVDPINQEIIGGGGIIGTEDFWGERYDEYADIARKLNEQGLGLFGQYISDNDRFKKGFTPDKEIIISTGDFLNSQGAKEEGAKLVETKELSEERPSFSVKEFDIYSAMDLLKEKQGTSVYYNGKWGGKSIGDLAKSHNMSVSELTNIYNKVSPEYKKLEKEAERGKDRIENQPAAKLIHHYLPEEAVEKFSEDRKWALGFGDAKKISNQDFVKDFPMAQESIYNYINALNKDDIIKHMKNNPKDADLIFNELSTYIDNLSKRIEKLKGGIKGKIDYNKLANTLKNIAYKYIEFAIPYEDATSLSFKDSYKNDINNKLAKIISK